MCEFVTVGWKLSPIKLNKNFAYFGKDNIKALLLLFVYLFNIYFDQSVIFYPKEYLNIDISLKY